MKASAHPEVAADGHHTWGPILETSAEEVFQLMLNCKLTVSTSPPQEALDMTSMVGLAGKICGVLSVRCDRAAATMMAAKMLGVEPADGGPERCDAFGEVCNMIAGNFKNKIFGLGDGCMLSVPTVITGNDYRMHSPVDSREIEVRFLFEQKPLVITLQLHD